MANEISDLLKPTREKLDTLAKSTFLDAKPFPHIVLDDFLQQDLAHQLLAAFPSVDAELWQSYKHENSKKLACTNINRIPSPINQVLKELNSPAFLAALERLTGIDDLLPDLDYVGGGLHLITQGGFLKVHADFNVHHQNPMWDRRLNLLIYLNEPWEEAWGGHLELWDSEMKTCNHRILPQFNRAVVFNTSSDSLHGHPSPLNCPPERARRSLAVYYYTLRKEAASWDEAHSTLYHLRPQDLTVRRRLEDGARSVRAGVRSFVSKLIRN